MDGIAAGGHSPAQEDEARQVAGSAAYHGGSRTRTIHCLAEPAALRDGEDLLWIGLRDPGDELLSRVAGDLGAEPRVVRDLLARHGRPRVVDYGKLQLAVAITVDVVEERPHFGEVVCLVSERALLTVRRGGGGHMDVRERLEATPELLARGADYVASEIMDAVADRHVEVATRYEADVEKLEQKLILRGSNNVDVRRLYRLRRDLLRIHNVVAPLAEVCRRLSRVEMKAIDESAKPNFADVADRVQRVDETINSLREALAFAFEAGIMIGQSQQNDITRRLAAWAAILAVPTAVAGIYGMNFDHMPELHWRFGYPAVLGGITAACCFLYWRFRRSGWL